MDAHLDGELDAPAAHKMRAHLRACELCAALFEERRRVRDLVRRAVRRTEAPSRLAGAIRAMMRQVSNA